jgi:hypothetical protein
LIVARDAMKRSLRVPPEATITLAGNEHNFNAGNAFPDSLFDSGC